jgi:REP element-mobilizing transposase RayT
MQLSLFARLPDRHRSTWAVSRTGHGGDENRGRRKIERPVSTRRAMHVTLHSQRAVGDWGLLRHRRAVHEALRACARRSNVRVYDFANVGSHLHLLVRARRRESFQAFLRSFAGIVARKVTGARRGLPLRGGPFWTGLAWSRVVSWGRDYWGVRGYIFRNQIEATAGAAVRRAFEQGPASEALGPRPPQNTSG